MPDVSAWWLLIAFLAGYFLAPFLEFAIDFIYFWRH